MREYIVYFEIFGKKLKTKILADNPTDAKKKITDKMIFHKVQPTENEFNKIMDMLDEFGEIINPK